MVEDFKNNELEDLLKLAQQDNPSIKPEADLTLLKQN
jgi:hypothetical protein